MQTDELRLCLDSLDQARKLLYDWDVADLVRIIVTLLTLQVTHLDGRPFATAGDRLLVFARLQSLIPRHGRLVPLLARMHSIGEQPTSGQVADERCLQVN